MEIKIKQILKEFKRMISDIYGQRLTKVVLYGSYARGQANDEHSDIDLAVVLEGEVNPCREIDRMIDIITEINLEYNVLISVYPVSEKNYSSLNSPLLLNIRKEGVAA